MVQFSSIQLSLFFKYYSFKEFAYLMIRFSKTKSFLGKPKNSDSTCLNEQNTHTHTVILERKRTKIKKYEVANDPKRLKTKKKLNQSLYEKQNLEASASILLAQYIITMRSSWACSDDETHGLTGGKNCKAFKNSE